MVSAMMHWRIGAHGIKVAGFVLRRQTTKMAENPPGGQLGDEVVLSIVHHASENYRKQ